MPKINKGLAAAVYWGILGITALGALAHENVLRVIHGENIFVNIWYYFTYQSAGIITLTLLASSYAYYRGTILQWRWLESLRGAATLYSVITGVVFAVLVGSASPAAMIDHHVLHQFVPVMMVLGWVLFSPRRYRYRDTLKWLVYPLAYAGFVLVIGRLTSVYPYDFLNPTEGGYVSVVIMVAILLAGSMLVTLAMVKIPFARMTSWVWQQHPAAQLQAK